MPTMGPSGVWVEEHEVAAYYLSDDCVCLEGGNFPSISVVWSSERVPENELMVTILIIVLILVLIGALPTWPYSGGWGYGPSGILGLILLIAIIWLVMRAA
jgi:hypothetical protein